MSDFRLQVFKKVAKRLNLTQAAQELGISQPAVSKHIQELEAQYGTQLLLRSGGKINLTPAGKLFAIHTDRILDQYGALEAEMYRMSNNYCGELAISADSPIVDDNLFTMFLAFCHEHPCIKISFKETSGESSKQLLHNNKIDIAFTHGPYNDPELQYTPYANQEWVFVVHADSIFAKKDKATMEQMITYKLNLNIFKSEATLDYNVLLQNNKFCTHFANLDGIKYLMYKKDSVSLLPRFSIKQELKSGDLKIIDIDGLTFNEEVGILTRPEDNNHVVNWFLEFAQDYNPELYQHTQKN